MIIVWIIILAVVLYGVFVVAGSWILQFLVIIATIVSTPIREAIRLYKSNEKKTLTLLFSFIFAIIAVTILILLLVFMP